MEWRVVAVRKYPKEFTNLSRKMMKQTLPIINKPKQPTKIKEKYKEQKGRTHHIQEEDKKNHLRG